MNISLKVSNMKTNSDVSKIKEAMGGNDGVVACEILQDKGEIQIVYDEKLVTVEKIISSVEDKGYSVSR
ncbi:copper chaperone [Clostridium putrefaciens]|uniref:Copper chaperone n=1 Tax=Clostridium putrefaciens TaxID=99675 RepID=A0A381JAR5_9CLOT|nr:heavy-metal-associated domain-containing protein [Clostridium putrefaciens]SUY48301.1 copper chaperone [Clostridium putrefaciens]